MGERFQVFALVAGRKLDVLCFQIQEFTPKVVAVADETILELLKSRLSESSLPRHRWPELAFGPKARIAAVIEPDVGFVMSAIVGVAGLEATYAAIRAKKRIGLANKEVLVVSGRLVMQAVGGERGEVVSVGRGNKGGEQGFPGGGGSQGTRASPYTSWGG